MKKFLLDLLYTSHYKCPIIFLFLLICFNVTSQDSSGIIKAGLTDNRLLCRFTFGLGWGSGYPNQEEDCTLGGMMEIDVKKRNNVYGIGFRRIQQIEILSTSNVPFR